MDIKKFADVVADTLFAIGTILGLIDSNKFALICAVSTILAGVATYYAGKKEWGPFWMLCGFAGIGVLGFVS